MGGHNVLVTDLGERKHISNGYKGAPQYVQINVQIKGFRRIGSQRCMHSDCCWVRMVWDMTKRDDCKEYKACFSGEFSVAER